MIVVLKLAGGQVKEFELQTQVFTIGRSARCTISLGHESLSREHCKVEVTDDGELIITDLNSTNGVYIGSQRIAPNTPTSYSSYLPITIGPIEGLSINFKEPIAAPSSGLGSMRRSDGPSQATRTKVSRQQSEDLGQRSKKSGQAEGQKSLVKNTIIILLIMGLLMVSYIYLVDSNKDELELPLSAPRLDF